MLFMPTRSECEPVTYDAAARIAQLGTSLERYVPEGLLIAPPRYCRLVSWFSTPMVGGKPSGGAFSQCSQRFRTPASRSRRFVTGENHSNVEKRWNGTL